MRIRRRLFLGGGLAGLAGGFMAAAPSGASAQDAAQATGLLPFTRSGRLSRAPGRVPFVLPVEIAIAGVVLAVRSAPLGGAIVVDVHRNGTTIFGDQDGRPRIPAGATTSPVEAVPTVVAIAPGDTLTVDVDEVGSERAGSDLTVVIRYT